MRDTSKYIDNNVGKKPAKNYDLYKDIIHRRVLAEPCAQICRLPETAPQAASTEGPRQGQTSLHVPFVLLHGDLCGRHRHGDRHVHRRPLRLILQGDEP